MSLKPVQTVPIIQAEELHRSLGISEPFEEWLKALFHDERFVSNYDFWAYGPDRLGDQPEPGQKIYLGMFMSKILALEQGTPQGENAYRDFLQHGEVRGFLEIRGIRGAFPTSNSIQSPVEPIKLRVV